MYLQNVYISRVCLCLTTNYLNPHLGLSVYCFLTGLGPWHRPWTDACLHKEGFVWSLGFRTELNHIGYTFPKSGNSLIFVLSRSSRLWTRLPRRCQIRPQRRQFLAYHCSLKKLSWNKKSSESLTSPIPYLISRCLYNILATLWCFANYRLNYSYLQYMLLCNGQKVVLVTFAECSIVIIKLIVCDWY